MSATLNFQPTGHRTTRGPMYRDPETGYELVQNTNRTWYFRDASGFIGGDNFTTKREAVEEANFWREHALAEGWES